MSYDRTYKQTNKDYSLIYIDVSKFFGRLIWSFYVVYSWGGGIAGYMQRVYIFTHLEFIQGRGWPAKCNVYTFLRAHSLLRGGVSGYMQHIYIFTRTQVYSGCGAGVRLHATYIHFYAHIVNTFFLVLNVKGNILCLKMLEFSSWD